MSKEKDFDIYDSIVEIKEERSRLEKQINSLKLKQALLKTICSHDVCVKFWDHESHKIGPIYYLLCPICENIERLLPFTDLSKTSFASSKILDLTDIKVNEFESYNSIFNLVQNEILYKYDYYYNKNISIQDLSNTLYNKVNEESKKLVKRKRLSIR